MGQPNFQLTVGPARDGRIIAIISSGGHPQRPDSGVCHVCTVAVVDGWSKSKIKAWFKRMVIQRPWDRKTANDA